MNTNQTAAINASVRLHVAFFAYTDDFNASGSKDIDGYTEVALKAILESTEIFNNLSTEDKNDFGPTDYVARLEFNKQVYAIIDAQKVL